MHLRPVRQRQRIERAAGVDQRFQRDLIGGLSVRLRREIAPAIGRAVAARADLQRAPGDVSRLGVPVFHGHQNGEAVAGEGHERPAVHRDPVMDARAAHRHLVVLVDDDFPRLLIQAVANGHRVAHRLLSDALKGRLAGKIRAGLLPVRDLVTGDADGVVRLRDRSVAADLRVVHARRVAQGQDLAVFQLRDRDAVSPLHRAVVRRHRERAVDVGFYDDILIEDQRRARETVFDHDLLVGPGRRDLHHIGGRVRVLVIDHVFGDGQVRLIVIDEALDNGGVKHDLPGGLVEAGGDGDAEFHVGHGLQPLKVRIVLVERHAKLSVDDLEQVVRNACGPVLIHNLDRKRGRPDVIDDNALREVVEQNALVVKLDILVFMERERHLIRTVRVDDVVAVLVHRGVDRDIRQKIRQIGACGGPRVPRSLRRGGPAPGLLRGRDDFLGGVRRQKRLLRVRVRYLPGVVRLVFRRLVRQGFAALAQGRVLRLDGVLRRRLSIRGHRDCSVCEQRQHHTDDAQQ